MGSEASVMCFQISLNAIGLDADSTKEYKIWSPKETRNENLNCPFRYSQAKRHILEPAVLAFLVLDPWKRSHFDFQDTYIHCAEMHRVLLDHATYSDYEPDPEARDWCLPTTRNLIVFDILHHETLLVFKRTSEITQRFIHVNT